ncbi:MAG: PAS domain S-box protein [Burkholderiaceae bacterium]
MRTNRQPYFPVAIFVAITIGLIILFTTWLLWSMRMRVLENDRRDTISITHMLVEQTERNFESIDLVLKAVQDRFQTVLGKQLTLDSIQIHLLLGARASGMQQIDALYLVDANGSLVNSSQDYPVLATSVANRDYFKAFVKGKDNELFIGKPVRNTTDQSWTLHLARKINGSDGKLRAIIVAAINTAHFEDVYQYLRIGYERPVSLYRDDGMLIASLPRRDNMVGDRPSELGTISFPTPGEGIRFVSHLKGDGAHEAFTLGRVPKYPLLIGVTNEEEDALASWRETAIPIILGAAASIILIIVGGIFLVRELLLEQTLARALGEAHDRYHRTIDSLMDAIVAVDDAQNILLFNPAAERMFGRKADEVMGKPLATLIPHRARHAHEAHVKKFAGADTGSRTMGAQLEIAGMRADGSEFPIESTISHTHIDGKQQSTAVLRDVTERHKAEMALREMNQQLRGLSASLLSVREQERTRIARELHDDLGQQLTGLKLDLSWLSNRVKESRPLTADKIDDMRQSLDVAISSVRRISAELRPLILDDLGFEEALTWHANEFAKRAGLDLSLNLQAVGLVKNNDLATAIYRIVQESLTNIARHANARQVDISLTSDAKNLVLTVSDNGNGIPDGHKSDGFGLVGMRERANALGGNFQISSGTDHGVTVRVEFNLDQSIFSEVTA